ncbi:hypothetical protein [Eleftheria terrae]|uniref:hypothetical protein n=1 Tax=Eleftheria terrae TaxID=1597781 RepID=UPI00263B3F1B|nr:hypothetical protein [Eleftheria terrae]WKB54539.1 hypothetical protein N7L95_09230 [Eleftheria terrae]
MTLHRLPLHALAPRRLICGLATAWLAACSTATPSAPAPAPADKSPQALMKAIDAEIGDAACSSDAQCRTLPVGAKACGGPEAYLPWSTQRGNADRLAQLAREHAEASRIRKTESGMASTCSLVVDPGAQCTAGRCSLRGADQAR